VIPHLRTIGLRCGGSYRSQTTVAIATKSGPNGIQDVALSTDGIAVEKHGYLATALGRSPSICARDGVLMVACRLGSAGHSDEVRRPLNLSQSKEIIGDFGLSDLLP
jgi:hypothetical protein